MQRIYLVMLVLAAVLVSGGCSLLKPLVCDNRGQDTGPEAPSAVRTDGPEEHMARARALILTGKDDAARQLLQKIEAAKTVPGVTDEALFRLGLLYLKVENEASGYPQTRQALERLIQEYPGSVWAMQAMPLNDLLVGRWMSEQSLTRAQRQVRVLKDSNLSLTRENKEMRLNIEKLKNLELELEQKSRR